MGYNIKYNVLFIFLAENMNECPSNKKLDISSPTDSTDSGIQINLEQTAMVWIYSN